MSRRRARDDEGSITPFVLIVSLGIMLLAGLVIDGGRQLDARGVAVAYAEEAARAGSESIDIYDPRLDLSKTGALSAAKTFCATAQANDPALVSCVASIVQMHDPAGTFSGVQVETKVERKAIILQAIGNGTLTGTGTAIARPQSGIASPDSGKISTLAPPSVASAAPTEASTGQLTPPPLTVTPFCPTPTPTPGKPSRPGKPGKPRKPGKTPTGGASPQEPCITPSTSPTNVPGPTGGPGGSPGQAPPVPGPTP